MLHIMWDWSFIQCENLSMGNRWVRHGKHRCILLPVQRRKLEVVDKLGIIVHLPNMWRDNTANMLLPRLVWLVLREQRLFHVLCTFILFDGVVKFRLCTCIYQCTYMRHSWPIPFISAIHILQLGQPGAREHAMSHVAQGKKQTHAPV